MMNNFLSRINWDTLFNDISSIFDLNQKISLFYSHLNEIFLKCVPKTSNKVFSCPRWYTSDLKALKNKKNKAFNKYKKYHSIADYVNYTKLRYEFTLLNNECYNRYLIQIKNEIKLNSKNFYSFVNSKKKTSEYPSFFKYKEDVSGSDFDIADFFANFFNSTYSSATYDTNFNYPFNIPSFDISLPSIEPELVMKYLKSCTKSGPDNIPSIVLKKCADFLFTPLCILFRKSLEFSYFPDIWKKSFLIPLHKSGNKSDVINYRGIAKLSTIPKLFEHIIADQLSFSPSNVISTNQHGFLKGRSIVTNLLEFTSKIFDGFSSGFQTDVVYTDFSKAFDSVNHALLVEKLNLIGLPPILVEWISSYLSNRSQNVLFRDFISKPVNVSSGVPQGSHLGPILFNIFINDLPTIIHNSSVLMYADDVKLFLPLSDPMSQVLMQEDLSRLCFWCKTNLMTLNIKKCKLMSFYRRSRVDFNYYLLNNQLDVVNTFVDLGIVMDPKLSFVTHINNTVNKARSMLGFIKRWAKELTIHT